MFCRTTFLESLATDKYFQSRQKAQCNNIQPHNCVFWDIYGYEKKYGISRVLGRYRSMLNMCCSILNKRII